MSDEHTIGEEAADARAERALEQSLGRPGGGDDSALLDEMLGARHLPAWARGAVRKLLRDWSVRGHDRPDLVNAAAEAYDVAMRAAPADVQRDRARLQGYVRRAMRNAMIDEWDEVGRGERTTRKHAVPHLSFATGQRIAVTAEERGTDADADYGIGDHGDLSQKQLRDLRAWARGMADRTPSRQQSRYLERMSFDDAVDRLARRDLLAARVVLMRHKWDRPVSEVAKHFGVTRQAAHKALRRGDAWLVRRLDAWSDEPKRIVSGLAEMVAAGEVTEAQRELDSLRQRLGSMTLAAVLARATAIQLGLEPRGSRAS